METSTDRIMIFYSRNFITRILVFVLNFKNLMVLKACYIFSGRFRSVKFSIETSNYKCNILDQGREPSFFARGHYWFAEMWLISNQSYRLAAIARLQKFYYILSNIAPEMQSWSSLNKKQWISPFSSLTLYRKLPIVGILHALPRSPITSLFHPVPTRHFLEYPLLISSFVEVVPL